MSGDRKKKLIGAAWAIWEQSRRCADCKASSAQVASRQVARLATLLGGCWIATASAQAVVGPHAASAALQDGTEVGNVPVAEDKLGGSHVPGPESKNTEPEDIIVTATRRETLLQDTPLSISVFSERELSAMGADGFMGFSRSAPGLTLNQGDPGRGNFAIRGISTGIGASAENQAPVALYVDEFPTDDSRGANSIADLSLFDVKRVEVLRGPQGTLFGSGALGGAIRVITNHPDPSRTEARLVGDYWLTRGGADSKAIKGMINLPIIEDRLALRAVGYYRDTGGYVDNVATGRRNANGDSAHGGRISLRLDATERLNVTATAIYQRSENDGSAALDAVVDGKWVRANRQPNSMKSSIQTYNILAEYDMGWASLMSSTTWSRKRTDLKQGFERAFADLPLRIRNPDRGAGFAQELRLTSQGDGPFSWVAGAFYFNRRRHAVSEFEVPGAAEALGYETDILQLARLHLKDTERALYGEGSYRIDDRLSATIGLRWFSNTAIYADTQSGPQAGGQEIATGPLKRRDSKVTPKFVLSYKAAQNAMIYVSGAQGYRIGGANVPNALDPAVPDRYRPDSLWNYELGAKTTWLDGKLILNAALYYIDWSDIQIERTATNDVGFQDNGGKAHSAGIELEATVKPLRGLELSSAVSLNRARADETVPGTRILKGDHLPGARGFTISNSIEYSGVLSSTLDAFVRADHQYQGSAYSDFDNANAAKLPAYHLINLRIGVTHGAWKASLYSNNLLNNQRAMLTTVDATRIYRLVPRTIGIAIETAF